jgi:hypothetical protein
MDNRTLRGIACCPWNTDWVCCWSGESRDVRLYESTNGKLLLRAMLPEIVSCLACASPSPPHLQQVSMPRSFAWGPKTPTGTCAVGLINGRVAVTRLLPQVKRVAAHGLYLLHFALTRQMLTRPLLQRPDDASGVALLSARHPRSVLCLDWNAQLPGVIASGLDKARNDNCIQGVCCCLRWWLRVTAFVSVWDVHSSAVGAGDASGSECGVIGDVAHISEPVWSRDSDRCLALSWLPDQPHCLAAASGIKVQPRPHVFTVVKNPH